MGNLRERVVTLVSDNRNMTAKTSSQREQSKWAGISIDPQSCISVRTVRLLEYI